MFSPTTLLRTIIDRPLLAAENNRLANLGVRFREDEKPLDFTGLFFVIGGMLALVALCWLLSYWHSRREARVINCPRKLFRELCRSHGLNRAERRLLQEIAAWHSLTDPVQLFLEPQRFLSAEMHESLNCEAEANSIQYQLFGN